MPQSISTHLRSILLLDNSESDALALRQMLNSLPGWQLDISIHLAADGIFYTTSRRFDLLLVTAGYANSTPAQIIDVAKIYQPQARIVLLSAAPQQALSPQELIDAGRGGVSVCLAKDTLSANVLHEMLKQVFPATDDAATLVANLPPAMGEDKPALSAHEMPDDATDNILDDISLGIIRFSTSGEDFVYRLINRAAAISEQLDPQELVGRRLSSHEPSFENFNLAGALRQARNGAIPQTHRVLSLRDDATACWRDITIQQTPHGDLLVEIQTATERAQREADRRHDAQIWRHIARSLPDMCALLDDKGKVVKVISGEWQHLDINSSTLTGQPIVTLLDAAEREKCTLAIHKALNTGKTQTAFCTLCRAENQIRLQVKISLLRAEVDAPRQVIWAMREVGEPPTDFAAAENDREFFNELLQRAPLLTAIGSVEGCYEHVNPAFAEYLQLPADTIIGKSDADLFPESVASALQQLENEVIAEGLAGQTDIALPGRAGEQQFRVVKVPIYGMSMLPQHIFTFAVPMTPAFPVAAASVAEANSRQPRLPAAQPDAIEELVGDIARDFNDVLVNLTEHTRMTLGDAADQPDSEVTGYLQAVMKSSQRARDLVLKMMAYQKHGNPRNDSNRVDLSLFMNGIVDLLGNTIGQQLQITRDIQQHVLVNEIDSLRMQNALIQLFRAAEKSFIASGQLSVRMQLLPELNLACGYCYGNMRGDFIAISMHSNAHSDSQIAENMMVDLPHDEALLSQTKRIHELLVPYSGHILFRGQRDHDESWFILLATDPEIERSLKICPLEDH